MKGGLHGVVIMCSALQSKRSLVYLTFYKIALAQLGMLDFHFKKLCKYEYIRRGEFSL